MFEAKFARFAGQAPAGVPSLRSVSALVTPEEQRAPKYVTLREHLRDLVGRLEVGALIPSERVLSERFGVARMTVRQAVDDLVGEGVLVRVRGRGTFKRDEGTHSPRLRSFTEEMTRDGRTVSSSTLSFQRMQAGAGIAHALGITEGDAVLHWRRVRSADGQAVCLQESYLVEVMLPGFAAAPLPASLWVALAERGMRPVRADTTVSTRVITAKDAALLGAAPGAVGLEVVQRLQARVDVVELSRTTYLAERYSLRLHHGERV